MTSTWHVFGLALEAAWVEAWGTWVGGLGTVGTLVFALTALGRESQRRRQDINALRDAERKVQDAEARTVVLHTAGCGGNQGGQIHNYQIWIGNYGVHPITNVVSELTHKETGQKFGHARIGQAPLPVLKGLEEKFLNWDLKWQNIRWPGDVQPHELPDLFDLIVRFTDVHGIRWAVRPGLGQQPSREYDVG